MSKFMVLVSDGDGWDKVSNHMYEGGYFPSRVEASRFANETVREYDRAGFEVDVLVMEVTA
jgi:hypothetical protein